MKKYSKENIIFRLLELSNKNLDNLIKDKQKLLLLIFLFALSLFIITRFQRLFFVSGLIITGSLSMIYVRYFKFSHYIGFELCTLTTVLTSIAYGPITGAFTGFISIFLAFIISGNFKPSYFISVLTLPLIGIISPFFFRMEIFSENLAYLGLFMTLIYDAIILPLYIMIGGSRIYTSIVFFATHLLLNYWVFSIIAPLVYGMMV